LVINKRKTRVFFAKAHKNAQKNRQSAVERFMTKKVIAIAFGEVLGSLVITRPRLNLRFRKSRTFPQYHYELFHLQELASFFEHYSNPK